MKTSYLFPNKFKKIGWFLFLIGLFCICYSVLITEEPAYFTATVYALFAEHILNSNPPTNGFVFNIIENNLFNELFCLLLIVGGLFIAFSKQKVEDEFISKIRLESLVWATYVNYLILILSIVLVYNLSFLLVLELNMFTVLIFFIIRFNWMLVKSAKLLDNEK